MFGRIRFVTCAALFVMMMAGTVLSQEAVTTEASDAHAAAMTRPISLDVQEAEIHTVLRSLASFSGSNIVASPRVEGKVTVKLEEVPWEEALQVILKAHSFDYIE